MFPLVRNDVSLLGRHLVVAVDTGLPRAGHSDAHASLAADGLVLARGLSVSNMIRSAIVQ